MANNCKHIKCNSCGGIKLKRAYIGVTLNEVCSDKCLMAAKDSCSCKCKGKFHKGNNSTILNEILKPKVKKNTTKKVKKVVEKVKKVVKKVKPKVEFFEPETIKDEVALFIQGKRFLTKSFDRFSDKNLRRDQKTLALNWLSTKGQSLDVAALDFINLTDYKITESEVINLIVEIILDYPSGIKQYIKDAINDKKNREESDLQLMEQNYYNSNFDNYNEDENYKSNTLRFELNGIKNMKLKKGSAAAKAFMAKIRAKKSKVGIKKPASKLSGYKKGSTRFIEKGEKPFKTKKTVQVSRRITTEPKGTFKKFTVVNGLNKIGSINLNIVGEELTKLDNDIKELGYFIRAEKTIKEKNKLKEIKAVKTNQFKALKNYLNSIAKFR